jgi:hypothetical protein
MAGLLMLSYGYTGDFMSSLECNWLGFHLQPRRNPFWPMGLRSILPLAAFLALSHCCLIRFASLLPLGARDLLACGNTCTPTGPFLTTFCFFGPSTSNRVCLDWRAEAVGAVVGGGVMGRSSGAAASNSAGRRLGSGACSGDGERSCFALAFCCRDVDIAACVCSRCVRARCVSFLAIRTLRSRQQCKFRLVY